MSDILLVFALVAFVAIATPGPTVLLALTNGSRGHQSEGYLFVSAFLPQFISAHSPPDSRR